VNPDSARRGAVIVTGGGGGIGAAVAQRFAEAEYGVVVNDVGVTVSGENPTPAAADHVVADIEAKGGRALAHYGSVTDANVVEEMLRVAVDTYGQLDAIVTCHGILRERMIFNMTAEEWASVVDVHLNGTYFCFRYASAQMREQGSGSIVALTSAAGLEGSPAQANYAAAKAGIMGLAFSTALAMGKYGVNVNCIVPAANTRMTARLTSATAGTRPADERQSPDLIAELALALAEPPCRHITGQLLTAAGQRLARWQPPTESSGIQFDAPPSLSEVEDAVCHRLGVEPLRRFEALSLPSPSSTV
jgi:NAD(P)-dependent dehydrogenase (short-subunit alcohol dehydrogenase family)